MLSNLFNPRDVADIKAIIKETNETCNRLMEVIEKPSFKSVLARLNREEPGETVILATIDKGTLIEERDGHRKAISCPSCQSLFHSKCLK